MSRHRHDRVVIAPGADTTCFDGVREITEPTLVGLDRRGRPRTFGSRATSLPAEEVVIPFGSVDVFHIDLAAAYLDWLIGGFHARIPVAAILTPIGAGDTFGRWQGLVERMSRHVVLLSRPMAAAVGLGLDVDSPGGSLVVEVTGPSTSVAVLADGAVVVGQTIRSRDLGEVAALARSALVGIDPDLEWDVRQSGVHILGDLPYPLWARDLGERLGLTVHQAGGRRPLLDGALATVDSIRPYFRRSESGSGQRRPGLLRILK